MARSSSLVLIALLAAGVSAHRDLLQTDTCPISQCAADKCAKKQLKGQSTRVWTCGTCKPGFTRANDGRACVCSAGKYEKDGACERCPEGSYCIGGAKALVEAGTTTAAERGPIGACDTQNQNNGVQTDAAGLTGPKGATKISQCITKPGFLMKNPSNVATQASELCPANRYNAGGNRATKCTTCPTGLVTSADNTPASRSAKNDCLVPPGYFWNTRASKPLKQCAAGSYRSDYTNAFADSVCTACPDGVTTGADGSDAIADCKKVKAGYEATAYDAAAGYVTDTQECGIGYHSATRDYAGVNDCAYCGRGKTTLYANSDSADDCVPNAASDDVAVTCPADGTAYGFDRVDNANKPAQTFKVQAAGAVNEIDVYLWGLPAASVGQSRYTLKVYQGASLLGTSDVAAVSTLPATCAADAVDECDGDFASFNFATPIDMATDTEYRWVLECDTSNGGQCGYYGYCNFGDALDSGVAYEGSTELADRDNAFLLFVTPDAPQQN